MDKTTKKVLAGQIIGVAQDVKQVDGVGQVVTVATYGLISDTVSKPPGVMQFCADNNVSKGDVVTLNDNGGVESVNPKSKEQTFAEKALQQLEENGWSAELQKANPSIHAVGIKDDVPPPSAIPPGVVIDEYSPLSVEEAMEIYDKMNKKPVEGTITVTYDRPKDEVILFEVIKGLMDKKCFKNIDIRTESEDRSPNVKLKVEIQLDVFHNAMANAIFKMLQQEKYPHKHHNKPKLYLPQSGKPKIHLLKRLVRTNANQEGETGAAA